MSSLCSVSEESEIQSQVAQDPGATFALWRVGGWVGESTIFMAVGVDRGSVFCSYEISVKDYLTFPGYSGLAAAPLWIPLHSGLISTPARGVAPRGAPHIC